MGLRNFMYEGTYTRIDQFWFIHQTNLFEVSLAVYDENMNFLTFYKVRCDGNPNCIEIDGILETDEEITSILATPFTEKYLVKSNPLSIYNSWNNVVLTNVDGVTNQILTSSVYVKSSGSYLEFSENGWVPIDLPNCDRFFNEHFSLGKHKNYTDIYNMAYIMVKMKQEFKNCIDVND